MSNMKSVYLTHLTREKSLNSSHKLSLSAISFMFIAGKNELKGTGCTHVKEGILNEMQKE